MEAIALRGLYKLNPSAKRYSYNLTQFNPKSVKTLSENYIARFGLFQFADIQSILSIIFIVFVMNYLQGNYLHDFFLDDRFQNLIYFAGYELIMESFFSFLVPLVIKPCCQEF